MVVELGQLKEKVDSFSEEKKQLTDNAKELKKSLTASKQKVLFYLILFFSKINKK